MQGHPRKTIENDMPIPELLNRAQRGDIECQYWAGLRYFQGEGVPKDTHKAVDFCTMAADGGDVRAYAFLAYCSSHGIGMTKSIRKSTKMYRISAKAGYAPAQYSLGLFYLNGKGLKKNVRTAIAWFERAARQNYTCALVTLGNLYHQGEDVVQYDQKACGYYRAAAELGSPAGQYMLSKMLIGGFGVARDPLKAFELLDEAAAKRYDAAVKMQAHFDEFFNFDPKEAGYEGFPIDHPFPIRRRTAIGLFCLETPCYQTMARDIYDYVKEFPEHEEAAMKDVAVLLKTSTEGRNIPLPIFWCQG